MTDLDTLLQIPFVIRLTTVRNQSGEWVRRAECPELPGCVVESEWAGEAVEALDQRRIALLREWQERDSFDLDPKMSGSSDHLS